MLEIGRTAAERALMYKLVWDQHERMQPFRIDQHIADGETLPIHGGLHAIHVPAIAPDRSH